MNSFTLIIATVIRYPGDLQFISETMDQFNSVENWTIDMNDCDHVLRVCCNENIALQIVAFLKHYNISSTILGIFED